MLPDKKEPTVMGKLLSRYHSAQHMSKIQAEQELWKRNGLGNQALRDGYKLAVAKTVTRDGTETTEYRLYKLIDASIVTISAEVNAQIQVGVEKLRENNRGDT